MRTVFKIVIWLGIGLWFIAVMGFVNSEMDGIICNQVEIVLKDSVRNRFVTAAEIRDMINAYNSDIQGYPVKDINIRDLEHRLEENPYIRNAEVFSDISGRLNIEIYQREPLIRVIPENGQGFYIDREGYSLPLSSNYSALIMLATGYIESPGNIGSKISVKESGENSLSSLHHLRDLYAFGLYLDGHPFWSSQIVQIYLNREGEYELIPRVGSHQILLGSLDDYRIKLRNLEVLYRQGFKKNGWNSYDKINLKYLNQVICTKR
ncbi:MAG: hypothetical protein JXR52_12925 [Bacteroidales bacterium]|nr:hypothetical protein [Bacteroidales bacterium]MBN2699722.1 hypothetical protein [Bacteroidales bacterium]